MSGSVSQCQLRTGRRGCWRWQEGSETALTNHIHSPTSSPPIGVNCGICKLYFVKLYKTLQSALWKIKGVSQEEVGCELDVEDGVPLGREGYLEGVPHGGAPPSGRGQADDRGAGSGSSSQARSKVPGNWRVAQQSPARAAHSSHLESTEAWAPFLGIWI